jgi:hypothetical protein
MPHISPWIIPEGTVESQTCPNWLSNKLFALYPNWLSSKDFALYQGTTLVVP